MIKTFKKELNSHDYNEIRIINLESGEFTHYFQDKNIGFIFSDYTTTVFEMGYKSVKECIKELRSRGLLGQEVDYKEQKESERIGYIKLGVERIKRAGRVNTNDFEDVITKLSKYGMGFCDAQNVITETYLYQA
jgi:hypothetical protein